MALRPFVLAACASPTPEVIVVTATLGQPTAADVAPTDEPELLDDGLPASFLTIIQPGNGTQWNIAEPIQVTGYGRDLPDDRVLIFAIDQNLNILGQSTATLGPPYEQGIQAYLVARAIGL